MPVRYAASLLSLLLLLAWHPLTSHSQDDPVTVTIPDSLVGTSEIGETIQVPLSLDQDIEEAISFQLKLNAEDAVVDIVNFVREGTALQDPGGTPWSVTQDTAEPGSGTISGARANPVTLEAGTFIIVEVELLARGSTALDFSEDTALEVGVGSGSDQELIDIEGVNGSITINDPPEVIADIDDLLVQVDGDPEELDLTQHIESPLGDELTFSAVSEASDIAAVSVDGSTLSVEGVASGITEVTITGIDDIGDEVSTSFEVDVNAPPIVENPVEDFVDDNPVTIGQPVEIDFDDVFSDPDGDPLSFSAESSDADAVAVFVSGSTLEIEALASGESLVTVTADDGRGGSTDEQFTVEVNSPPEVVSPIEDIALLPGDPAEEIDLTNVFDDPDGDELSFDASSGDPDVISASVENGTLVVEAIAERDDDVTVTVTADDGRGGTTESSFDVLLDLPPLTSEPIDDVVLLLGDDPFSINLADVFSDPLGGEFSWDASSDDPDVASVSRSGSVVDVTAENVGSATVTVSATSEMGETAEESFEVTVIDFPDEVTVSITRDFEDARNPANYRLVALPGDDPVAINTTLSGSAPSDWRAFWDDGSDEDFFQEFEEGSDLFQFVPGRGFWLLSEESWEVEATRATVTLTNGATTFDVHEGWNIISNPFEVDVDWDLVQAASSIELNELWGWDGSWDEPVETFSSAANGEAFYVFAEESGEIVVPYPTSSETADLIAGLSAAASDQNETRAVRLSASLDGIEHSRSAVQVETGWEENDQGMSPAPRSTFATLQMHIDVEDEAPLYSYYTSDAGEGIALDIRVEISEAVSDGQTLVLNAGDLDAFSGTNVFLFDSVTGSSYDLQQNGETRIPLRPGQMQRAFELLIGPDSFVQQSIDDRQIDELTMAPNYPNPFSDETTLTYTLPEELNVELTIFDMLGREIRTLTNGVERAGEHTVTWAGDTSTGSRASSGVYIARLRAGDTTLTERIVLVR